MRCCVFVIAVIATMALAQQPAAPAASSVAPDATRVTLHFKDEPISKAFAKFAEAAHVQFIPQPADLLDRNADQAASLDCDNLPFWQALPKLCYQAQVAPARITDSGIQLMRDSNSWSTKPMTVCGPFRIAADGIEGAREITLGRSPKPSSSMRVIVSVQAEPAVLPIRMDKLVIESIFDSDGKPITQLPPPPLPAVLANRFAIIGIGLDPSASTQKIGVLKGRAEAIVVGPGRTLEIPDILNATGLKQAFGDFRLVITSRPTFGGGCTIDAKITNAGQDRAFWEQLRDALGSLHARLFDAQGAELTLTGGGWGPDGRDGYRASQNYKAETPLRVKTGPAQKLVWDLPSKMLIVPIQFEFKDLPLPQ